MELAWVTSEKTKLKNEKSLKNQGGTTEKTRVLDQKKSITFELLVVL